MRKIIHISDMHFGKLDTACLDPLITSINKISPHLVVISGDFTQRARIGEFEDAALFIHNIKAPCFLIPGNHDIRPLYSPLKRITDPYDRYKRYISDIIDPGYIDDELAVASITTIRPSAIKDGRVNKQQVDKAKYWLLNNAPHASTRIIVTHHPFDLPIEIHKRKLARKAEMAMHTLSEADVDMYLSGHYHRSSMGNTAIRYKIDGYSAIAVQAGTVSTRQRGELQSFNVITIDKPKLKIERHLWDPNNKMFHEYSKTHFNFSKGKGWAPEEVEDVPTIKIAYSS